MQFDSRTRSNLVQFWERINKITSKKKSFSVLKILKVSRHIVTSSSCYFLVPKPFKSFAVYYYFFRVFRFESLSPLTVSVEFLLVKSMPAIKQ